MIKIYIILLIIIIFLYCIYKYNNKNIENFDGEDENQDRVKYYMGDLYNKKKKIKISKNDLKSNFINPDKLYIYNYFKVHKFSTQSIQHYIQDFEKIINKKNYLKFRRFICKFGDINEIQDKPTIVKSRRINNKENSIIFKLNNIRHFDIIRNYNWFIINWEDKINEPVWRGTTTGYDNKDRLILVQKYYKKYNIGFNDLVQNYTAEDDKEIYIKNDMTYYDQLKYKYLISIEGNDVSTGLKWMLVSNSVVLMKKPTMESWIMEDKLKPYVHYVPLNDNFDNLEEIVEWCIENDDKCKEISKNATNYMRKFFNTKNEKKILLEILERYQKNVKFIY